MGRVRDPVPLLHMNRQSTARAAHELHILEQVAQKLRPLRLDSGADGPTLDGGGSRRVAARRPLACNLFPAHPLSQPRGQRRPDPEMEVATEGEDDAPHRSSRHLREPAGGGQRLRRRRAAGLGGFARPDPAPEAAA